ncbi:MAG: hypothetical protein AB7P04_07980 [Bacteriovoracia bacterium]
MDKHLLFDILSQPTAPYRERHVIRVIMRALQKRGVPHFQDPVGNIIIGVKSRAEYLARIQKKTKEPVRVFIAHLDHPGFHGVKWVTKKLLAIQWYGGSPTKLLNGAALWSGDARGWLSEGKLVRPKMHKSGRWLEKGFIQFKDEQTRAKQPDATKIYGGFRFRAPVWEKNQILYTKAADDLIGAFAITSVGLDFKKMKGDHFLGVLTRAEEVGFIGAIGHLELGWLQKAKRPVVAVSLEASRTLPGAKIGAGPVVRLGDRATVFNPNALKVFAGVAEKVLPKKHQKRVMDGGTCEATAATAYGFPAIGISVPLGNYHNESYEGGPDSRGHRGPGPEFVHLNDIEGMLKLCQALVKPGLPWAQPWEKQRRKLKQSFRKSARLLKNI